MNYNIGDFIITNSSKKPGFIVGYMGINQNYLIVSIDEYSGDYILIPNNNNIIVADITSEEKLSILANFGSWFYDEHKLLYQELIIENLA